MWFIRWVLWRWRTFAPPAPGPMVVANQQEVFVLRYTVDMPPRPAIGDLATREVTAVVDATKTIKPLAPDAASFTLDVEAGAAVSISLVDIDSSGNRSGASPALEFTAEDTVPPPVPGGLAVGKVEQID